MEIRGFWQGAFILTLAGLLVKVLSAGYRIPYQNIAGDLGFYIYQQVYPLYGMALTLTTYGFPVILSKYISEQNETSSNNDVKFLIHVSFWALFMISGCLFILVNFGATKIASIMGDPSLDHPIRMISYYFLFIPFISVFRGFFQGKINMLPTAISQIIEQLIRVLTILILVYTLLANGYDVYAAGAGAFFGSITGAFSSLLLLLLFWIKYGEATLTLPKVTDVLRMSKVFIINGLAICAANLFLILVQMIDAFTIYSLLKSSGVGQMEAKIMKGVFDRGIPLIQLGTVMATSFSLTLVPMISSAKSRMDSAFIKAKVNLTNRMSIVIGIGASVGLALIVESTNIMLYENDSGSNVLKVLSFTILFSTMTMTSSAVLQGIGRIYTPAVHILLGLGMKLVLNLIFVPKLETMGAALATVLAFLFTTCLNLKVIKQETKIPLISINLMRNIIKAVVAMASVLMVYQLGIHSVFGAESRLLHTFQALSAVILGGVMYLLIILRSSIFKKEEILTLPLGRKLQVLMKENIHRKS